jgi:hypothetical protein
VARLLKLHGLECLVRGFFGPIIFCALCDNLPGLQLPAAPGGGGSRFPDFLAFWHYATNVTFTVDLAFAAVGYVLPGSRLWSAHFRSAEPTALGWAVCLACYQPFFHLLGDR